MSFNRLSYDTCTYSRHLNENISILGYIMNSQRFENKNKCRHELGLVGGTAVSHVKGNLVDLESDLRGQTRYMSKCTARQWHPITEGQAIVNDKTSPIETKQLHLPACQMLSYRAVPLPEGRNRGHC